MNSIFSVELGFLIWTIAAAVVISDCSADIKEGEQKVFGQYFYLCQSDKLVPAGCLDDLQNKVAIGGTFVSRNTQKTCVLTGDGKLSVTCTACVSDDGQVIQLGQTVDAGSVYFGCVANGEGKDLTVAGCIINGQKVAVGGKLVQDDQVMTCQRSTFRQAAPVAQGCVYNGRQYDIGVNVEGSNAFYHCKKDGHRAMLEAIGCINDGKRVYDLDIFQNGNNFYRCRAGDTAVSADLWGCAFRREDGTIEPKSIACTWDSGSDPINYVNCCIKKGDSAVVTQLYCLYTYRNGRVQVNEGCFRIFDTVAAGCKRNADGSLTMSTWNSKDVSPILATGLHQC